MPDEAKIKYFCRISQIICLLLLLYGTWNMTVLHGMAASASGIFTDASLFYDRYGSRNLIFHEGAFYYGSKGKAGDPNGIRYGVSGQRFTFRMENGSIYTVEVALDEPGNAGSCKRISYVKKDGYYYSLYQVLYDKLYDRLHTRYSWVNFNQLMYNHYVHVQADFLLTCVRNGRSDGYVKEQTNGTAFFQGTVYETADQVLGAAEWSADTKKALPEYFGIQMNIYQPSVYYVQFHRNSAGAEWDMPRQQFVYGKAQKLDTCCFRKEFHIDFDTLGITCNGEELHCDSIDLKSHFKGWGLMVNGEVVYHDQQSVQNLSDQNQAVIHLYAMWEDEQLTFPLLEADEYRLLGWCTDRLEISKKNMTEAELHTKKIYPPESVITPYKDYIFYAVWKKKEYRIQFEDPYGPHTGTSDTGSQWHVHYDLSAVDNIRKKIAGCGFAGARLNQILASAFISG